MVNLHCGLLLQAAEAVIPIPDYCSPENHSWRVSPGRTVPVGMEKVPFI
jgi:hypothetical protein